MSAHSNAWPGFNSQQRRSGSVTAGALSWNRDHHRLALTFAVLVLLLVVIVIIFFDQMRASLREPDTFRTFAWDTLVEIVPASFLLAHFGQELVTIESGPVSTLLLVLNLVVLVPLLLHLIGTYRRA